MAIALDLCRGEFLAHESQLVEYFYVLASGRLKAFSQSTGGKKTLLNFFSAGDLIGPFSVFQDRYCCLFPPKSNRETDRMRFSFFSES